MLLCPFFCVLQFFTIHSCKIGTLYDFYRHVMEYVYSASKENPQAMRDFSSGVAQKCGGQAAFNELDIMLPMKSFGIVDKLKCVIKALGKAVKDTDYESVYDELKKELEEVLHNIEACKEQSGVLGKTKYVSFDFNKSFVFIYFLKLIKNSCNFH